MPRITLADEGSGIVRETFVGSSGVQRLNGRSLFVAAAPDDFRADYRAVRFGDATFESFRITACSGTTPADPPGQRETIRLGTVVAGRIEWRSGGQRFEQDRGPVHVIRSRDEVAFDWPEPTQLLSLELPVDRLPRHLMADGVLKTGQLPGSPLLNGFSGFLRQLAAGPMTPSPPERAQLARVLDALVVSVLALAAEEQDAGVADLRFAIHDHIERHLGEADLGPRQIAAALDVSVRWVHRVFNVDGQSVAKHIRDRRVDQVAEVLRSDPRTARMGALSEQFGFGGRDQLARAFRARYGTTVREYQDLAAAGGALPAPREVQADLQEAAASNA